MLHLPSRLHESLDIRWNSWLRDSHGSLTEVRLPGPLVFAVIRFPRQELGGLLFELGIDYSVTLIAHHCSGFEAGKTL